MTIHFICKGNTFRSRLAETYLSSKQIPGIEVVSSGIEADQNDCGPVSWYTQRIIQDNHLVPFEKPVWDQTTKLMLEAGDLTIFMHQNIYDYAVKHIGFTGTNFQIWDISDIRVHLKTFAEEIEKMQVTERIFEEIKQKVDELIKNL